MASLSLYHFYRKMMVNRSTTLSRLFDGKEPGVDVGRRIFGDTRRLLEETQSRDDPPVEFEAPATKEISRGDEGVHGEHHHLQRRILAEEGSRPSGCVWEEMTLGRHSWGPTFLAARSDPASPMWIRNHHFKFYARFSGVQSQTPREKMLMRVRVFQCDLSLHQHGTSSQNCVSCIWEGVALSVPPSITGAGT